MSNKKNDDEYFFDDEDLGSFASELDDDNKQEKPATEDSFDAGESRDFDSAVDTDDIDDDEEESNAASGFADKLKEFAGKHTRVLLVVGAAIVAIIGLKVFLSAPSDAQKLMKAAPVVQRQAAVQQTAPVVIQKKPSVSKKQLNSVAVATASNKNSLNALQSRLGNMSAKQADTEDAISQLSSQIQQMQATNQQLNAQVKLMEKREQDKLKKETYKKTHYVHYKVRALESGRAWLMGSNGMSATVSVGSKLAHYGEVLSIDVENGTVVTSSGDTLKYNLSERVNSAVSK